MKLEMKKLFEEIYNEEASHTVFSPGRINLIGEHIDYSGGFVFPCAITYGTYAAVKKRTDRKVRLYSDNFKKFGVKEFSLDELDFKDEDDWTNYAKGVLKYIQADENQLDYGFDLVLSGNIPNGAGLSSSASLEMLIAKVVQVLYELDFSNLYMIQVGMRTENEYIGVNSGIMDQFAIMNGEVDHALLLNTNSLEYEKIPLRLNNYGIVIMNTNKRRGLNDSHYNERRVQCEEALEILQEVEVYPYLCDYSMEQLEANKNRFKDELVYKRARHAISENIRTIEASKVLQNDDLHTFGQLMSASHASLRDDYDVTGEELDTLVAQSLEQEGVLGARVTGAGFGGCAIALVHTEAIDDFIKNVGGIYLDKIGYEASFYIATAGQGTTEM